MSLKRHLSEGRLVGSRCKRCGYSYFPPAPRCPNCRGPVDLVDIPKRGVVLTYSTVYVSNGRFKTPYTVAIAKFGDFQLPGYVEAEKIEIGDEVIWEVGQTSSGDMWYVIKRV
jgi:uncharacterized OB-fold protein